MVNQIGAEVGPAVTWSVAWTVQKYFVPHLRVPAGGVQVGATCQPEDAQPTGAAAVPPQILNENFAFVAGVASAYRVGVSDDTAAPDPGWFAVTVGPTAPTVNGTTPNGTAYVEEKKLPRRVSHVQP
ncbi:hypothetical protein [Fodinicola feengrottensis]|uniref:hypothetical protein n=1 Tax=Fodinicola feengrottensis TaxID=435914 RepID=UPI0013D0D3A8|nr:hypothetical protein [Fodinicola feengrottensis]